jgi:purine nucleoside permease
MQSRHQAAMYAARQSAQARERPLLSRCLLLFADLFWSVTDLGGCVNKRSKVRTEKLIDDGFQGASPAQQLL